MKLPSLTVALKNVVRKSGEQPIIINIIFNRTIIPVPTGFKVRKEDFRNGKIIGENAPYKNRIINEQLSELELKFIKSAEQNPLTVEQVRLIVRGESGGVMTLTHLLKNLKRIYADKATKRSLQYWETVVNKFDTFIPNANISTLKESDFIRFESFLKTHYKNKPNTIWGDFKTLKSILNKGVKHKLISSNPMKDILMPGYQQTKKTYLNEDEIKKIETYADDETRQFTLRKVAAWFAMACRSGLRYGDLGKWEESEYIHNQRLYFTDDKENTPHFIPLYPALSTAIERLRWAGKIMTDQKCNMYLKMIAVDLNIKKHLTMHIGRHTFAVNYLDHGGDIKVLQKLMGHKKLTTTEVYGQITDKRIETEALNVFSKL